MTIQSIVGPNAIWTPPPRKPTMADVVVDLEDQWLLDRFNWTLSIGRNSWVQGVVRNANGCTLHLARVIMNCPPNLAVDHKDGNVPDNKRYNLRICTPEQNMRNQAHKGYTWEIRKQRWRVRIVNDAGVLESHMSYATEIDAQYTADNFRRNLRDAEYCRYHHPLVGERAMNGQLRLV
jgi:hypothetical protein